MDCVEYSADVEKTRKYRRQITFYVVRRSNLTLVCVLKYRNTGKQKSTKHVLSRRTVIRAIGNTFHNLRLWRRQTQSGMKGLERFYKKNIILSVLPAVILRYFETKSRQKFERSCPFL